MLDVANPNVTQHHETTLAVLKELGADEKKVLVVLNKIDLIPPAQRQQVASHFDRPALVSLKTGEGMTALLERLSEMMLDRILESPDSGAGIEALRWMEPKAVAQLVAEEHPQVIAIVLAQLDAAQASSVMLLLPDEQIAAVLTYVRNSFGNSAPAVTVEQVKALRGEVGKPMLTEADLVPAK